MKPLDMYTSKAYNMSCRLNMEWNRSIYHALVLLSKGNGMKHFKIWPACLRETHFQSNISIKSTVWSVDNQHRVTNACK